MRSASESKAVADRNFKSNTFVIGFAIAAGIAAASALGWLLTRSMLSTLKQAVDVAERIARGELGFRIESATDDEFGAQLGVVFQPNDMRSGRLRRERWGDNRDHGRRHLEGPADPDRSDQQHRPCHRHRVRC